MDIICKHFASRAILLSTPQEAEQLYNEAAKLPHTATRDLLTHRDIYVDGPLPGASPANARIVWAWQGTKPVALKFGTAHHCMLHEVNVLLSPGPEADKHHVVPLTMIEASGKYALMMELFVMTVEHLLAIPMRQRPRNVVLIAAKSTKCAMHFLHEHNIVHCD